MNDSTKFTLTLGQLKRLVRESIVSEEVWEPSHQPGDLHLSDEEIRADLKTLLSRKVSNPINRDYEYSPERMRQKLLSQMSQEDQEIAAFKHAAMSEFIERYGKA